MDFGEKKALRDVNGVKTRYKANAYYFTPGNIEKIAMLKHPPIKYGDLLYTSYSHNNQHFLAVFN